MNTHPSTRNVMDELNLFLNGNKCPGGAQFIGECALIDHISTYEDGRNARYEAYVYLHDEAFNDSAMLAELTHDAGGSSVWVMSVLYDDPNGVRDGRTVQGLRAWIVSFDFPFSEGFN